ncbi:tetratricopeptide repeat-containing sensor histidine kinase [Olivibacter domesticus]|uniref:histidine kinase n=1 Tax=Olivibacter domesticus TaxID=407022 RepID=A0A1H7WZW4_OLID1|nr:sensor histidine kinase [Olivibacter domesticus]SEM26844.1 Histidine kinase-, DNA gyrase B-, and HSP90-like ATPase [Olivibacter domesticus]
MSKLLRLTFLLLALSLSSKAQQPLNGPKYADSLQSLLKKGLSDSIKARANFLLFTFWLPKDISKAKQYLDDGKRLSIKYPFLKGISYAQDGYFYYATDPAKSEIAYMKADSILKKFNTKEAYNVRSNLWVNYAVIQQRKDDDRAFIDIILNKAIPLAKQFSDSTMLGSQYVAVSVAFMNLEQYDKAETYLNTAIQFLRKSTIEPSRLVAAYNRAGENYILLKKYPEAKQALDSIKHILTPYPQSELYAGYYLVEGMYYHHLNEFQKALISFDKGIGSANGPNKVYRIQEIQFFKIKSLIAAKKFQDAKKILLNLSSDEELMSLDDSRLEIYAGMSETYAGLEDTRLAYLWNKRYSELSDSLNASRLKNDIHELEIKYQDAEKQKKITKLEAEKEKAVLSSKNTKLANWLLGITSVSLLIIAIFILYYYRNKGKLATQKEINYKQQLKEMEHQQQLITTKAVLEGEEKERARVARDLHDGLGGMLAGVKINLSGWAANHDTQTQDVELSRIIGQLDNSVKELRLIARNMMPETLLKFGLETALRDLCESIMSESLHVDFQPFGIKKDIPLPIQITVYRIVQEILSNTIRHAKATNIVLQCSLNEGIFFITAEDNGIGFDANTLKDKAGMGLNNIKNRVEYLKGKVEIISTINEGTTVNIELNTKI